VAVSSEKPALDGLIVAYLALLLGTAAAETPKADDFVRSAEILLFSSGAALSVGREEDRFGDDGEIDYWLFTRELLAFVANEVIPESRNEYADSPNPSALTDRLPSRQRSRFSQHCRVLVDRGARELVKMFRSDASDESAASSYLPVVARGATTAFVLRDVVSAFQKREDFEPRHFSVEPKVGSRKVEVRFGFHW
jgi:hypothetical protein